MTQPIAIEIPILARVEGEGALSLHIRDQQIETLQLRIYEPPRLFEKFLEGRPYQDVIDLVARICGICPVAYQMSAAQAIESAFQMGDPTPWVRQMRRLFYCGEWLESHSTHIHLLAAPDFFGFDSALAMAKVYPEVIKRGLRLQGLGNAIIRFLGGRSVNPVGACVGGFYRSPTQVEAQNLLARIQSAYKDAVDLLDWALSIPLPDNSHDFTYVSLSHPDEYPMNEGCIASNTGLRISIQEFAEHFQESQVPYSNALQCHLHGEPYLVGPLARLNLNIHHIPEEILTQLAKKGLSFPNHNLYHSLIARAIEIYYAILEGIRILEAYEPAAVPQVMARPQAGSGFGCTEAPRGLLWQTYTMDAEGNVSTARIVPPTSQNQAQIEKDLRISLTQYGLDRAETELRHYSEMVIRNYDPCISCATHFLDLRVSRS